MPDPVADILRTVQTSDRVRAAAWDAAYASDDPEQVANSLRGLPIGDSARAKLWDARFAEPEAPSEPPPQKRMFRDEMTGQEFRAADEANRQKVSDLAAEHPYITGGVLAAAGGAGSLSRAIGARGLTAVQRAWGAAAEAGSVMTPVVKYEIAHQALKGMGAPEAIAMPAALAISGYRRGGAKPAPSPEPAAAGSVAPAASAASTSPASPAVPSGPPASSPAAPAPSAAPSAPASPPARPSGPTLSPQRIQNELGIQARRRQVTLTEPQYKAATELVSQGQTPAEAVKEIASRVAPPPAAASATPADTPAAPPKKGKPPARARMTPDEADEWLRLTGKGMSNEEAVEAILAQRKLASKLGTPSPESARRRVAERNATGKWQGEP